MISRAEGLEKYSVQLSKSIILFLFLFSASGCFAQYNVTEIITDYNGYWKSGAAQISAVKPDNSHNLVSFSFNGNRYSTGVNDALLTSQGQSFVAGDYRALDVQAGSAVTSNTKIGLGYMYDGVANGPSTPPPANNIPYYLTDGIKGLNLGTCVANLPAGTLLFPVSKVLSAAIGDAVPDLLITQIADPSGSLDRYEFIDIIGNRVGNYVDIQLANIPPVGNWTADFYEASKNPMTLSGGFTKTDRPIRLWASDVSAFGINSSNASSVAYFKITLSGNSDVAFVAYNANAINLFTSLLPVKLNSFTGIEINNQVQLNWVTGTEANSNLFVIERSTDGSAFNAIGNVNAGNNTAAVSAYTYTDKNPAGDKNYYRLKMTDKDGRYEYSKVIMVNNTANASGAISMYPNPAKNYIIVNHPFAGSNEQIQIFNPQGNVVLQQKVMAAGFQTRIDLPLLPTGMYQMVWTDGRNMAGNKLMIQ